MALGPIAQIHISVSDLDKAVAFYRDVLGLTLLSQLDGQPMAFFQSGDVRLYLGMPESPTSATHTLHYFQVDDLHAERFRLEQAGVEFLDQPHVVYSDEEYALWMTGFKDPDGHDLVLMEERPTHPV